MGIAMGVPRNLASLRSTLHRSVDDFCDKMGNEPEEAQEELSKDVSEFIEDHIQENLPESSPLLQQARQEVRRRIQRPSVTACLEVQNPEESIWARALRRFQGMLRSLQQRCWDVLTWLQEKAAACLEAVCSAVKAVWGMLTDFCSSVGQLFRTSCRSRSPRWFCSNSTSSRTPCTIPFPKTIF
uniref:Uncharacterized protein n=1 Tax=Ovis aries TaxID=9940 RepID=A0AC11E5C1_SHEEP